MPELAGGSVRVVDVATDDELITKYGERLPVLQIRRGGATTDLDWPFEAQVLRRVLTRSTQAE